MGEGYHRDFVLRVVERRPGLQQAAAAAEGEVKERGGGMVAVVVQVSRVGSLQKHADHLGGAASHGGVVYGEEAIVVSSGDGHRELCS